MIVVPVLGEIYHQFHSFLQCTSRGFQKAEETNVGNTGGTARQIRSTRCSAEGVPICAVVISQGQDGCSSRIRFISTLQSTTTPAYPQLIVSDTYEVSTQDVTSMDNTITQRVNYAGPPSRASRGLEVAGQCSDTTSCLVPTSTLATHLEQREQSNCERPICVCRRLPTPLA